MLKLKRVVPHPETGELIRKSKDDREYLQLEFEKPSKANVLSTAKPRYRNVFGAGGTVNAKADTLFTAVKSRLGSLDDEGNFTKQIFVEASIQQIEVEPFYIPNEYGKHTDPETGEPANRVTFYTDVVYEDENIKSLAMRNGMTPIESDRPLEQDDTVEEIEAHTPEEEPVSITQ